MMSLTLCKSREGEIYTHVAYYLISKSSNKHNSLKSECKWKKQFSLLFSFYLHLVSVSQQLLKNSLYQTVWRVKMENEGSVFPKVVHKIMELKRQI